MSGELVEKVLEEALKEDKKHREMVWGQPVLPPPSPPVPVKEPSHDIPAGMKSVLWIPIRQSDDSTVFQCTVDGFGLTATATSRNKQYALAYCLEDMSRQLLGKRG